MAMPWPGAGGSPVLPTSFPVDVIVIGRREKVDPSGKRTIGVLTKPDLINPGGEAEVLEVLSNNRKPLKLGYVMVKVGFGRRKSDSRVKSR